MISEIEDFSDLLDNELKDALSKIEAGEPASIEINLTLTVPDADLIDDELARLNTSLYGVSI